MSRGLFARPRSVSQGAFLVRGHLDHVEMYGGLPEEEWGNKHNE